MNVAVLVASTLLAAAAHAPRGGPHIALPVPDFAACSGALPEKLSLGDAGSSRFGKLFAAEWAERVKAARSGKANLSEARSCSLRHEVQLIENPVMKLFNAGAMLSCGDDQIVGAGAALDEAGAEEMLAFSLAHLAAQAFCDPQGYAEALRRAEREAKLAQAATNPARCPSRLEVEAGSAREATLVRNRWQESSGGRGKAAPISCRFESRVEGPAAKAKQATMTGSLTCGASRFEASAQHADEAQAEQKVVNELVARLLGERCSRGPYARDPLNCAAMPKALKVKGPLAKLLAEKLQAVAGEAEPAACTVKASGGKHPRLKKWSQASGELRCGEETFRAVGLGADRADAERAVATALVNAMREERCPIE